ncbi:MAG: hypothetical protein LJE91_07885 [Gammaproteobacteria bacterium]|nr:hypothetical protein [Gammaproteobacteria bacterium]
MQLRPITTRPSQKDDPRPWYLSLRPAAKRLKALAVRVSHHRIPELERQGEQLAVEDLDSLHDHDPAAAIDKRAEALEHWKRVYWDEFIPLAHGVRQPGLYYNDMVASGRPL